MYGMRRISIRSAMALPVSLPPMNDKHETAGSDTNARLKSPPGPLTNEIGRPDRLANAAEIVNA
jgi:hypothetical protein